MLSASDTIRRLGGIARGAHLQTLGFTRRTLTNCVRRGEIQRIRDGVFAVEPLDGDIRSATAHGGALTCASVLQLAGIWVLDTTEVPHVWLGSDRHAHPPDGCACVSHFYRGTPPLGRASLETALVHFRRCAGDEAFFAAFESAWRKRLLSAAARSAGIRSLARRSRTLGCRQRPGIAPAAAPPRPRHPPRLSGLDRRCRASRLRARRPPDPRSRREEES